MEWILIQRKVAHKCGLQDPEIYLYLKKKKINHTAHLTIKSLQAFTLERRGKLIIVMSEHAELCASVNMHIIF